MCIPTIKNFEDKYGQHKVVGIKINNCMYAVVYLVWLSSNKTGYLIFPLY